MLTGNKLKICVSAVFEISSTLVLSNNVLFGNKVKKQLIFLILFWFFFQRVSEDEPVGGVAEGRLITVTTTLTTTVASTATVLAATQTLSFASAATLCYPSSLLSSLSISAC